MGIFSPLARSTLGLSNEETPDPISIMDHLF